MIPKRVRHTKVVDEILVIRERRKSDIPQSELWIRLSKIETAYSERDINNTDNLGIVMADDDESKAGERTTKISDHLESFTKHAGGDNRPGKVTITRKRSLKPTKLRGEDLPSGSTANKCSFCSRSFAEKEKCVEGDAGVLICSDCIKLCNKILDEDTPDKSSL